MYQNPYNGNCQFGSLFSIVSQNFFSIIDLFLGVQGMRFPIFERREKYEKVLYSDFFDIETSQKI